jgi:hypothetical protein
MSNPLKKIGKALRSVAKSVKKVFKSDIFKAVAIGAGLFFGIPLAATALGVGAGAAGGAAAGAGAKAWWSSTLGIGAGSAASGFGSISGATPITSTLASPTGGIMSSGPAMTGSLGQATGTGFSSAVAGGVSPAVAGGSAFGGVLGPAGNEVVKQGTGLLAKFKGLDPLVQASVLNMGGQAVSGWARGRQEEKAQQAAWDREDELQNRKSIFGVRYDGTRPDYDYNVGNLMNQAVGNFQPNFGNFIGANPRQKPKEEEIFAGYNPYWS